MAAASAYPSYRVSGLPWAPWIPEHWKIARAKNMALLIQTGPFGSQLHNHDYVDGGTPVINPLHLVAGRIRPNAKARVSGKKVEELSRHKLMRGDIIFARRGDLGRSAVVTGKEVGWLCGTGSILFRPAVSVAEPEFLSRLIATPMYKGLLVASSVGSTMANLNPVTFSALPIIQPPRPEQDQIVAYLSAQDAHIARFIKAKRDLIGLLTEQKLRIIDHAVTRGLDASVKRKPSGIEWLGDVPEHWEVQRLKNIADVVLGKMLTTEAKGGNGEFKPYLRSTNVQWLKPDVRNVKEMWIAHAEMQQLRIRKGDLLVSEGGEVGRACIWDDELAECYIQNSVHRVAAKPVVLPEFLLHQFFANGKRGRFNAIVNRVSIAHLTREKLVTVPFTLPPIEEQKAICRWIANECQPLDEAIARAEDEIKLIREYRDRLIADAVTGQVDLRGWQPGPDDAVSDDDLAALGDEEAEPVEETADGDE